MWNAGVDGIDKKILIFEVEGDIPFNVARDAHFYTNPKLCKFDMKDTMHCLDKVQFMLKSCVKEPFDKASDSISTHLCFAAIAIENAKAELCLVFCWVF